MHHDDKGNGMSHSKAAIDPRWAGGDPPRLAVMVLALSLALIALSWHWEPTTQWVLRWLAG